MFSRWEENDMHIQCNAKSTPSGYYFKSASMLHIHEACCLRTVIIITTTIKIIRCGLIALARARNATTP
jgi:hypothetical protein